MNADPSNTGISQKPLLITIPHSGERVPVETPWLKNLPETILMFDVDRYVDQLYAPVITELGISSVLTEWHRYAIDLNRWADDVDLDSVAGHANRSGTFPRGLHWSITTTGVRLMPEPMTLETHRSLIAKYFAPFHEQVLAKLSELRARGAAVTFHLDAHSMPSVGTNEHRDPGERRADVVVSDCDGKSCSTWFRDLVSQAYRDAGFTVAINWPYKGGRLTETYGQPARKQEAIQVELNRSLYMDEQSKRLKEISGQVSERLARAVKSIRDALPNLP